MVQLQALFKKSPRHSMYAIYAYIGVVLGVNVGIYGSPMECLGVMFLLAGRQIQRVASVERDPPVAPSAPWLPQWPGLNGPLPGLDSSSSAAPTNDSLKWTSGPETV